MPPKLRPLVLSTVAYFIHPTDEIQEDLYGPYGYVDDTFLCAFVADRIREAVGEQILIENWDGEAPLVELVEDILAAEGKLIGDERGKILKYIGYDRVGG